MPRAGILVLLAASLAAGPATALDKGSTTSPGTAITYQGELRSSWQPAADQQEFEACLFTVPTPDATPPLLCVAAEDQPVDDAGRFTLTLDFGTAGDGLTTNPAMPGNGAAIVANGTLSVRPAGIAASMIAPGAIGLAQIDPAQGQARIGAGCPPGDALVGIGSDGSVQCTAIPARIDRLLDHSGDVGSDIALALRDLDIALLAYHYTTSANPTPYRCTDRSCSSGSARTLAHSM